MRRRSIARATFQVAFVALVLVRVPSLAEPAGADQGLYAYVGERILHGDVPYRDAWDQKPPAIHYTYAAMAGVWPGDAVVAAVDLLAAVAIALLLVFVGRRLSDLPGAGEVAAIVFLLLANPAFTGLGGLHDRAQCETFIALAVTAGIAALLFARDDAHPGRRAALAGALLGVAAVYKYNAGTYLAVAALALLVWPLERGVSRARLGVALAAGFLAPIGAMLLFFAATGALGDLYAATVLYNLRSSGDTYRGVADFAGYLLWFPVQHARVDGLWFLGGFASLAVVAMVPGGPRVIVAVAWVGAACVSIAVNGSRGLPQYFVQAAPALALATGLAAAALWRVAGPLSRVAVAVVAVLAVGRVTDFSKPLAYLRHDLLYAGGRLTREAFLQRFDGYAGGKRFSALAVEQLGAYLAARTASTDRVLVFGSSPGVYVKAGRQSASRFCSSRPIVYGFRAGVARYGAAGLLADLRRTRPRFVALERHDGATEAIDSAGFFLGTPDLAAWLESGYSPAGELEDYLLWQRRDTVADAP